MKKVEQIAFGNEKACEVERIALGDEKAC